MTLLSRMDRLVTRIGLYPGLSAPPRPRHTRWLPLGGLALAAAGMAMHVAGTRIGFASGFGLILTAFVVTTIFSLMSPLRRPTPDEPLDEREKLLKSQSLLAGAMTVTIICLLGALLFSSAEDSGLWTPETSPDWRAILFLLIVVLNCVPPLYASWTTRPIPDEI